MFDTAHIHPMLVHFPIALTLLGVLFAALRLFKPNKFAYPCGEYILYFATLSAILAAIAGGIFTPNFTEPVLAQAKNIHSTFAGVTVTFLCIASAFYLAKHLLKKYAEKLHKFGFLFYILAAFSVAATGFLGGVLVYNDLLKM
ncbi:DUF2231 domain-containing protein [Bacteroides sp.]|uniref:DUF2231 domain-containing protein n=1 Tax=Bacteroides sp. TaxID=29523 RepID=UPI00260839E8|nr:DUF2231 domain-containing protein [Bacteroides sp.]MDD3038296.1 hypothetical protein [Bacteroides sp.]